MSNRTYAPPRPRSATLEVLKGSISEPIETVSHNPNSKERVVKVSLVKKGSGMIGLKDAADNQEWAGIFNHVLTTARVATFLGEQLREKGEAIDSDCILNTILVSHAGRRQYDEATWYPLVVSDAARKRVAGDTAITLHLLANTRISPTIVENARAHGIGNAYPISQIDTWEKILPAYADFRVSQHVMSLQERFDDLERRGVAAGRFSRDNLKALKEWAFQTERRIFSKLQIKPEHIADHHPAPPWWERYLRRLYVNDAEKDIFANLSRLYQILEKEESNGAERNRDVLGSWWEKYVRELYEAQRGRPYQQTKEKRWNKAVGIERAIGFFGKLDSRLSF